MGFSENLPLCHASEVSENGTRFVWKNGLARSDASGGRVRFGLLAGAEGLDPDPEFSQLSDMVADEAPLLLPGEG